MNAKKSASNKTYRNGLRELCLEILGHKCNNCGETRSEFLDFHHTNPCNKVASIAKLIRTNPALLVTEIQKCVLLCKNCHKAEHYGKKI